MTEPSPSLHVAIVDDHALLADMLAGALRDQGRRVSVVDPQLPDLVAHVAATRPDLVLLDLDLGIPEDGTSLVAPFVATGATVVVLTANRDQLARDRCLAAGAAGVLHKSLPFEALVDRIEQALRDGLLGPGEREHAAARVADHDRGQRERLAPFESLTPREAAVLESLLAGQAVEAIARRDVVSVNTVRTQVRSILVKLGVSSQLEAVARARDAGWRSATDA